MTQGEDASRNRAGHGPRAMAALRNTARNLARLQGQPNVAHAQRRTSRHLGTAQRTLHAA